MRDSRLTEQRNPRSTRIDELEPLEIVDLVNAEDRMVAQAVGEEREAIARALEIVEDTFQGGGRLIYVGAGTSGRLGVLDAAEMPPTFGTDPSMVQGIIAGGYAALVRAQEGAEDHPEEGAAAIDERDVGPQDFVRFHPGGSLGRKLTKVDDVMRPLDQCRMALDSKTLDGVEDER